MSEFPTLSKIEREILSLLVNNGSMYGLEMVNTSTMLKRGTIYVMLNRMQEKGWITSKADEAPAYPGMARRRYTISGAGQRTLQFTEQVAALAAAMPGVA